MTTFEDGGEIVRINGIERKRQPYTKFSIFLKENNIGQIEVARLLNKSVSAVNQNINGTGGDFTVGEVVKICKQYNLTADIFFN